MVVFLVKCGRIGGQLEALFSKADRMRIRIRMGFFVIRPLAQPCYQCSSTLGLHKGVVILLKSENYTRIDFNCVSMVSYSARNYCRKLSFDSCAMVFYYSRDLSTRLNQLSIGFFRANDYSVCFREFSRVFVVDSVLACESVLPTRCVKVIQYV